MQLSSSLSGRKPNNDVAKFLQDQATATKSRTLQFLAQQALADPFKKIRGLIEQMINKLKDEMTAEEEHHGFCTREMNKNEKDRTRFTTESNKLNATIEGLSAEIATQKEKIGELSERNQDMADRLSEAQELRAAEKKENTAQIEEAKVGATAVGEALKVLRDFYAQSGASLIQQPEIFSGTDVKQGGASTGVLGMLEVIESDFLRVVQELTQEEDESDTELSKFKADTEDAIAVATAETEHLTRKSTKGTKNMGEMNQDLTSTTEQLNSAETQFEELKPQCMPKPMSYEERKAARAREIDALKEAIEMLEAEGL